MKLILILFIISKNILAASFEVVEVKNTDRSRVFELVTDSPEIFVVLDCASFIHNLNIEKSNETVTYYLTVMECSSLYKYINDIYFSQRRCIKYGLNGMILNNCKA